MDPNSNVAPVFSSERTEPRGKVNNRTITAAAAAGRPLRRRRRLSTVTGLHLNSPIVVIFQHHHHQLRLRGKPKQIGDM
ncbi:hypothetical protein Hanom_Chr12g01167161 [Helianthus anomalus]